MLAKIRKLISAHALGATILLTALNCAVAEAATTLGDACGSETVALTAADGQKQLACKAAYLNANSYVRDDNGSRVNGAVAVVCAYNCIGGVPTSCASGSGGGGSPCSTAMDSGRKAFELANQSKADLAAAKTNGNNSLTLDSNKSEISSPSSDGSTGGIAVGALSSSCRAAATTGSVASRIDCALASDPTIPSFVKTARFQQDFQNITGKPLSDVINQGGATLLNQYSADAAQHAFNTLKGKTTLAGFVAKAGEFVNGLVNGVDEKSRGEFARAIIPPKFQGLIALKGGAGAPGSPSAVAGADGAAPGTGPAAAPADAANPIATLAAADGARAPASVEDASTPPEENRGLSLFARVSRRYHDVWERISSVESVFRKADNSI